MSNNSRNFATIAEEISNLEKFLATIDNLPFPVSFDKNYRDRLNQLRNELKTLKPEPGVILNVCISKKLRNKIENFSKENNLNKSEIARQAFSMFLAQHESKD